MFALRSISRNIAAAFAGNYAVFTTPGSSSWTVPSGVTSISAVAIGGGGAGASTGQAGGGGGGLAYQSSIAVTPG